MELEHNTKLLQEFQEVALSDKKLLNQFKNLLVKCQKYELAASVREVEKEKFPETDEEKEAKNLVREYRNVLGMVKIETEDQTIYTIAKVMDLYRKKKGKMNIEDCAKIIATAKEIFSKE